MVHIVCMVRDCKFNHLGTCRNTTVLVNCERTCIHYEAEKIPAEVVELREGEIRRLSEDTFVEKRNGVITIYTVIEKRAISDAG